MQATANEAADIITGTYGRLTITYRRLIYTWTVTVYLGTLRIDLLCATYTNAHAAWTEARRIALAAHQGKTVDEIFDAKPSELALAEAKRIINGVNANMDAVDAEVAAERPTISVQPTNWHRLRQNIAASNSATVRRIRPTRTNVHTQPPTPPQLDRMRQHSNGIVTAADGQPWTLLRGIVDRNHGEVHAYWPGTRKIQSVRLNQRGWQAIGQNAEVAA